MEGWLVGLAAKREGVQCWAGRGWCKAGRGDRGDGNRGEAWKGTGRGK